MPAEVGATPFASVATGGMLTVALRFPNPPFGASTGRSCFTTTAPSLLSHLRRSHLTPALRSPSYCNTRQFSTPVEINAVLRPSIPPFDSHQNYSDTRHAGNMAFSSKSSNPNPLLRLVRQRPFALFGLPFLGLVVFSSFALTTFTQTRYDLNDTKTRSVSKEEELGMSKDRKRVDIREEYYVSVLCRGRGSRWSCV